MTHIIVMGFSSVAGVADARPARTSAPDTAAMPSIATRRLIGAVDGSVGRTSGILPLDGHQQFVRCQSMDVAHRAERGGRKHMDPAQIASASPGRGTRDARAPAELLQLRVLRLGVLEDRNIGVGVFPLGEEILVGGASFGSVSRKREAASQAEAPQRYVERRTEGWPALEKILKLSHRLWALFFVEIRQTSQVGRCSSRDETELISLGRAQLLDGFGAIAAL